MDTIEFVPRLLAAGIEGNRKVLEATALMIARKVQKSNPDVAKEISYILAGAGSVSAQPRSVDISPLPIDKESRYTLVDVETPAPILPPVLDEYTRQQTDDFIRERELLPQFIQAGITPPNSLLLSGPPGVGKTYIAHWLSNQLNLPLVTLDLATSISSYLGRSGQNIRSVFDYAKLRPAVLFLDELDAIAKRRDDAGDLGELKRLVNVLLKEIEDYPITSVIIGATNHPELLDKAIWRRFDRNLSIKMPGAAERKELLNRHLGEYVGRIGEDTVEYISVSTPTVNASDVCKLCEHIKRQFILAPEVSPKIIALSELFKILPPQTKAEKIDVCKKVKDEFPHMTQREIAQITRIPLTTVSRYLSNQKD